jgi:hypothetical protein
MAMVKAQRLVSATRLARGVAAALAYSGLLSPIFLCPLAAAKLHGTRLDYRPLKADLRKAFLYIA